LTLRIELGAFLGWLDLNLVAALQRVLIPPMGRRPPIPRIAFVPMRHARAVRHRISVHDPV